MVFKSEEQLRNYILTKCKNAIAHTQEIVRQDMIQQADAFYEDYDPIMYDRTGQLNDNGGQSEKFIVKSPITTIGNRCESTVYLDASALNYTTGRQPSGEQVLTAAVGGGHGATNLRIMRGGGVSLWNPYLQEKSNSDLVKSLISQGLPLV